MFTIHYYSISPDGPLDRLGPSPVRPARTGAEPFFAHRSGRGTSAQTVSESGLFSDVASQTPAAGLIPYGVNSVLWSDGTAKTRFIALPGQSQIEFSASGVWKFPPNAVVVKNFYLELEQGNLASRHIVETRFLVKRGQTEAWDGFSYMWDLAGEDAVLLDEAATQSYLIADPQAEDGFREYVHFYPGPEDCALCHTGPAGYVLGLNTAQMNRSYDYGGTVDNQLRTLNHIGLFTEDIGENYEGIPQWADLVQAEQAPGSYTVRWDGRTEHGDLAASGTYLYRLRMGDYSVARQLVLVR